MNNAIGKATDVQQTLAYGSGKLSRGFLLKGFVAVALGAAVAYLQPHGSARIMMALIFAFGAASVIYGLVLRFKSKPLLVMSPAGLRLHVDFHKGIVIPWHEVRGVDSIDVSGSVRGRRFLAPGVTAVLVSRSFYDRHIYIRSWFLRGPGWDLHYIPKGDIVQVVLHHEMLPVSAAELRAAVEARWRAFRNSSRAATSVPRTSGQT